MTRDEIIKGLCSARLRDWWALSPDEQADLHSEALWVERHFDPKPDPAEELATLLRTRDKDVGHLNEDDRWDVARWALRNAERIAELAKRMPEGAR